jgi:hypothetical protein
MADDTQTRKLAPIVALDVAPWRRMALRPLANVEGIAAKHDPRFVKFCARLGLVECWRRSGRTAPKSYRMISAPSARSAATTRRTNFSGERPARKLATIAALDAAEFSSRTKRMRF